MQNMRRRGFLATTTATTLGLASERLLAANDKVVIAIIGLGGQGRHHLSSYLDIPNVDVAYVCDVDEQRLAEAAKTAPKAKAVSDLRKILDDKSVDAVSIATPDHWHTPAALLALAAGKHVYVEKPCSHNLREGRWLVEAAARAGKQVQHGTQSRSVPFIQAAMESLRQGLIGDVQIAKAWNVQFRPPIGKEKPSAPPSGFDYDAWLGAAPTVPFQKNRHHYTWHWWHDFGTGDAGNDGVHEIDIARWGLGVESHPSHVAAIGGKYVHDDDQEFPDTLTAAFEYPGSGAVGQRRQLIFEMRLWSRNPPHGMDNGNEFLGTQGRMLLTKRGKVEVFNERGEPMKIDWPEIESVGLRPHQSNFIAAIRSGAPLNANALTGHLSSSLPHLANLACRVGRSFQFDPQRESVIGDEEANQRLERSYRDHWSRPTESKSQVVS
jgi:predicted dehydrogenase